MGLFTKPQKESSIDDNIVFELLIKNGLDLNTSIENIVIEGITVYSIDSNKFIIATKSINEKVCKEIMKLKPSNIICLDSIFNNEDCIKTNIQLQFEDSGISFKTI